MSVGTEWGEAPSTKHKLGCRLIVRLDDSIDGSVRELMSTAVGLWAGIDNLHDDFVADAKDHAGEVPVVVMINAIKTETSAGTSFEPVFAIEEWVARPSELPLNGIPLSTADKKKAKQMANMDDEIPF